MIADSVQFVKDQSLADGNSVNAMGASNWGGVLNTLSMIANGANILAQLGSLAFGWESIIKDASKKALEVVLAKAFGATFSAVQGSSAGFSILLNHIDSEELAVEQMSVTQLNKLGYPPSK